MKNDKVRCERCGKWISICKMRRHRKKRCGISGGKNQPIDTRRLIQLYLEMIRKRSQALFASYMALRQAQKLLVDEHA